MDIDDIPQLLEEENRIFNHWFYWEGDSRCNDANGEKESIETRWVAGRFLSENMDIIKLDFMAMFVAFQSGELPPFHLNLVQLICFPKKRMQSKYNNTVWFACWI
jgi:hypothetical protein